MSTLLNKISASVPRNIDLVLTNRRAINENNKIILKGDEGEEL
jgi:hypothetical protein